MDAMYGIAELLVRRRSRIVRAGINIIRWIAVRTPEPFECALVRIVDRDSLVQITIGNVNLMGLGIYFHARGLAEDIGTHAVRRLGRRMANLHEEMTVILEFQNLTIPGAGSADPYIVVIIQINPMLSFRPVVASAGTAPGLQ